MKTILYAIAMVLALTAYAKANDDLTLARSELDAGRYSEAISIAASTKIPEGFALAARAKLIAIDLKDRRDRTMEEVEAAAELASKALEIDPTHVEGHLQASGALGLKSRIVGKIRSHMRGYGSDAKTHLDAALAKDPENPWALLYAGIWHVEIVARGGETMARASYGASIEEGFELLDRAIALRPDHSHFRYFYATNLLVLDGKKYHQAILTHLDKAIAIEPVTDYDATVLARCEEMKRLVEAAEYSEAKRQVDIYLGLKSAH